jgi:hypothetical protein
MLERRNPLALYGALHLGRPSRLLDHVDWTAKQLDEPVLHRIEPLQPAEPPRSGRHLHGNIDVRIIRPGVARDGAKQGQVLDSQRSQLRLVTPQNGENLTAIHGSPSTHM